MASIQATSAVHAPSPRRAASGAAPLPAVPPILSDPSYVCGRRRAMSCPVIIDDMRIQTISRSRCRSPREVPSRLLSPIRLVDRRVRTPCSVSTLLPCRSRARSHRLPYLHRRPHPPHVAPVPREEDRMYAAPFANAIVNYPTAPSHEAAPPSSTSYLGYRW